MSKNFDKEIISNWAQKSELERTIASGIGGAPEIKREEKLQFLGVFKERVLKYLTKQQVVEDKLYREIITALQDQRATKLLINGDLPFKAREKYRQKAQELGVNYTIIFDSALKGEVGLVVASDYAVEVDDIAVSS
ncbi:MAG: YueI family protein [Peptococcaceae bacterium]|nr:YueI family protein [Peptococcaceae bacterium]